MKPIFHRTYEMPYSLKVKLEKKLTEKLKRGILVEEIRSKWTSPSIMVPKKNSAQFKIQKN